MTRPGITTTFTLLLICTQFAANIWLMRAVDKQRDRLSVMHEELADWEQITETWKRSAMGYALAHDGCMRVVRTYQRSIFQPVEMNK